MKGAVILLASLFTFTGTYTYDTAKSYERNFWNYFSGAPWVYDTVQESGAPDGDYEWNDSGNIGLADEPLGSLDSELVRYYECGDNLYQVINNGYRFCLVTWKDGKVITIEDWELVNEE